ncbi:calcineurin subunit B [Nematostella vectensis]|uniref:calcineurin subunit B n=1 Tax=Nematostella vectensis TaxID=45351 RepID=UPI0013901614|nr:calcineurin subunit B [Nematostella vectensis]
MGTGASVSIPDETLEDLERSSVFNSKEIQKLLKRFCRYDPDVTHGITLKDFLTIPEVSTQPIMVKIARFFLDSETRLLTFRDFIGLLSVLSTRETLDNKKEFAFKVLDMDSNGILTPDEMFSFYRTLLGPSPSDDEVMRVAMAAMSHGADHREQLSYDDFCQLISDEELMALFTMELQLPK